MKSYLLTYTQAGTPAHVQHVLNDTRAVETWVAPFPYAAILISKLNTQDIAAVLRDRLPGIWFMVTELKSDTVQGWLPGNLWEYVNDPQHAWSRNMFAGLATAPSSEPSRSIFARIKDEKSGARRPEPLQEFRRLRPLGRRRAPDDDT